MTRIRIGAALTGVALAVAAAVAQPPSPLESILDGLTFRNIGPFRTAAWVTEIAVPETPVARPPLHHLRGDPHRRVVEDDQRGHHLEARIDSTGAAAVGAVADCAVEPERIVWIGAGDQANARSSYSGKGVFKSIGRAARPGSSWDCRDSHHIARIVIHPTNPRHRVRRRNRPPVLDQRRARHLQNHRRRQDLEEDRSTSTTASGAIDLVINRSKPSVLYAAMYDKAAPAVGNPRERPGERRLPERRRRRHVEAAGRRTADRARSAASASTSIRRTRNDPLRARREPEPEAGRRRRATSTPSARSPRASSATSSIAPMMAGRSGGK